MASLKESCWNGPSKNIIILSFVNLWPTLLPSAITETSTLLLCRARPCTDAPTVTLLSVSSCGVLPRSCARTQPVPTQPPSRRGLTSSLASRGSGAGGDVFPGADGGGVHGQWSCRPRQGQRRDAPHRRWKGKMPDRNSSYYLIWVLPSGEILVLYVESYKTL